MDVDILPRLGHMSLGFLLFFAVGSESYADPYFQVTNFGSLTNVNTAMFAKDGFVSNAQSGVNYPFPVTTDFSGQPSNGQIGITVTEGVTDPVQRFYPMSIEQKNANGTVLGLVPDGSSLAIPNSRETLAYAQMLPGGAYLPAIRLFGSDMSEDAGQGFLNSSDQVAYMASNLGLSPQAYFFDAKSQKSIDLEALLPPGVLSSSFAILGLADNGVILAQASRNGEQDAFLFTPSALPLPAPEPTSLAVFLIVAGGFAVRAYRKSHFRSTEVL